MAKIFNKETGDLYEVIYRGPFLKIWFSKKKECYKENLKRRKLNADS